MSELEAFLREPDALISFKTTFFREPELIKQYYLKMQEYLQKQDSVKIASIACSDGKEPYSLSMLHSLLSVHEFEIHGFDINKDVIKTAKKALYYMALSFDDLLRGLNYLPISKQKLHETREELIEHFKSQQSNEYYKIPENIKKHVKFHVSDVMEINRKDAFDAVMCQNFVYHFKKPAMKRILETLCTITKNEGILMLDSWYPPANEYHKKFNKDYFEIMPEISMIKEKKLKLITDFKIYI